MAGTRFFTIGYGGRRPDDFVAMLQAAGVKTLVDVRLRPDKASIGSYTRARTSDKGIEALLARAGIDYRSLIELGNVFLDEGNWTEHYRELMAMAGDLLTRRLADVPGPFCLMCAEKRVADCHRRLIAEHLHAKGYEPVHLE